MHTPFLFSIWYWLNIVLLGAGFLIGGSLAFFIMRGALKYPSAKLETAETAKNKIYFQCNQ